MIISNDIKKELRFAKNFTITPNYIILYTGTTVVICNKQFNLIKKIQNIKYVYNGYVSSDEKSLLLVSNVNRIYIISLEDYLIKYTYTAKKPYSGNLEGRACWSATDNTFFIPVQNEESMLSTIRQISCFPNLTFNDYLTEKFWIVYISFVQCEGRYLAIGLDRKNQCWNLIWWNQNEAFDIKEIQDFNDAIFEVELIQCSKQIVLTGETQIYLCDFDGLPQKSIEMLVIPEIKGLLSSCSIEFGDITCIKFSQNKSNTMYIGTSKSLIVWDLSCQSVIKSFEFEFGVHNVEDLQDGVLLVSTWTGVKVLEI